jgi:hypothetical protein
MRTNDCIGALIEALAVLLFKFFERAFGENVCAGISVLILALILLLWGLGYVE